eukprot:comp23738_c0_seq1/m.40949 comp23738_c0_seq1/g.40949  ORF comp23738_c0_seq1/g.40949 comp23738_c0_seq1/m.40949 type:complete len:335 (-) comp23738_c0_seq1:63-1067(-)
MCIMSASPDVSAKVTAMVARLRELMEGGGPADEQTVGPLLLQLETAEMTREILAATLAGHCVKALRKYTTDPNVSARARELIKTWQVFRPLQAGALSAQPRADISTQGANGLLTAGDSSRSKRAGNESPHEPDGSKKTRADGRVSPQHSPGAQSPAGPVKRPHDQTEDDQHSSQHRHKKHRPDDRERDKRPPSVSAGHSPRPSSHTPTPTQPAQSAAATPKAETGDGRATTGASTRPGTPNLAVRNERPTTPMSPSKKDRKEGDKEGERKRKEKNGVVDTATEGEANGEKKHKKKKDKKEKESKKRKASDDEDDEDDEAAAKAAKKKHKKSKKD